MTNKQLFVLPFALLMSQAPAYASALLPDSGINVSMPIFFNRNGASQSSSDYGIDERNISVSVSPVSGTNNYLLTATGVGNFTFFSPGSVTNYAGTATGSGFTLNYTLTASGATASNPSTPDALTINGALPASLTGSQNVFSANLTNFAFDKATGALGFATLFNTSFATQTAYTGGSSGETVYLFDQAALNNGGNGRLAQLLTALEDNSLESLGSTTTTFSGIEALLSLPLPTPAALFGAGIAVLFGFKQRKNAN